MFFILFYYFYIFYIRREKYAQYVICSKENALIMNIYYLGKIDNLKNGNITCMFEQMLLFPT